MSGWLALDVLVVALLTVAAQGYAVGVLLARPKAGSGMGLTCAVAFVGPVAGAMHMSFAAHMASRPLLGMVSPLLGHQPHWALAGEP